MALSLKGNVIHGFTGDSLVCETLTYCNRYDKELLLDNGRLIAYVSAAGVLLYLPGYTVHEEVTPLNLSLSPRQAMIVYECLCCARNRNLALCGQEDPVVKIRQYLRLNGIDPENSVSDIDRRAGIEFDEDLLTNVLGDLI